MKPAPIPADEPTRQRSLDDLALIDSPDEPAFDDLAHLAAIICGTPIALISLVDGNRQWFKSRVGLAARETPRDISFCGHAIVEDRLFEVPDAAADPRFADNPLVLGEPNVRFYAAVPLAPDGRHNVGTLCVIDHVPRRLTNEQREALSALGRQAVRLMDMRNASRREVGLRRDLFAQSDLSRSMIEHAGEAIISADLTGVIRSFNPAAERLLGYTAADLVNRATPEIFHDPAEVAQRAAELSAQCGESVTGFQTFVHPLRQQDAHTAEWTYVRKDRTRIPVMLTLSTLKDDGGQPVGYLGMARDLSDRHRQAEQERTVACIMDIIRTSQADFIGERRQLEEQQRLRFQSETLLKEVHHRVKNNMQVISSLLSIQSAKLEGEQQRGVFLECRERIRAMSLIHDRLYSTGTYEQIDFAEYLREMLALIVSSNRPDGTEVAVTLEAVPLQMSVDRAVPLSLIASELVLNSLKHGFHGRPRGALVVRLERRGDDCLLFVGDDGPGIGRGVTNRGGVGMQLVETLTRQIRGRHEVRPDPPGAGVTIHWREP